MTSSFSANSQNPLQKANPLRPVQAINTKASLHLVLPQGQIQVHTGSYRGSFSVVLSEALRAAGLGSRVLIAQLLKGGVNQGPNSIVNICGGLDWIRPDVECCLSEEWMERRPEGSHSKESLAVKSIWDLCKSRLKENLVDRIVLDEIGLAISLGFIEEDDLISTLNCRQPSTDVILTGPSIPSQAIEMADQITELRCS